LGFFDDPVSIALISLVVVIAGVLVAFFVVRRRGKKETAKAPERKESSVSTDFTGLPFKVAKSVTQDTAGRAKDELRILELEREILSDAIRRLYEAHAEGKITEQERERLAQTYKSRMMTVKDAISKDESVVALHELEAMQEDLLKLFSERFDDLSGKIEELRTKADTKPIREIAIPAPKPEIPEIADETEEGEQPAGEEKAKRKRKPPPAKPSPRTEAEKRIEEIRNEVEKVLDRLGQMEVES
jgi:hypothetical protein